MSFRTAAPAGPGRLTDDGDDPALSRTFILIVLTEAVTIAALYWFGHYFS